MALLAKYQSERENGLSARLTKDKKKMKMYAKQ